MDICTEEEGVAQCGKKQTREVYGVRTSATCSSVWYLVTKIVIKVHAE